MQKKLRGVIGTADNNITLGWYKIQIFLQGPNVFSVVSYNIRQNSNMADKFAFCVPYLTKWTFRVNHQLIIHQEDSSEIFLSKLLSSILPAFKTWCFSSAETSTHRRRRNYKKLYRSKSEGRCDCLGGRIYSVPCRSCCFALVDLEEYVELILFFQIDRGKNS